MDGLDRIASLFLAQQGDTLAYSFIHDVASRVPYNMDDVVRRAKHSGAKVFMPPKEKDRVLMFTDNSGVYVHEDFLCTPMGDIGDEVDQWQEV